MCVLFNAVPVIDGSAAVCGALGLFQDISDLKRSEEAVRVPQRLNAASRLASSVTQELTIPLQMMAQSLSELQQDDILNDTARYYATVAQQELLRLGTIARRALAPYGATCETPASGSARASAASARC